MEKRTGFTSKIGFVLATAGSAVGLGNLWRFPYLAAKYGGGIFLLVYLILTITFGFTLMLTELTIGRKTKSSASVAYQKLNAKHSWIGALTSIVPFMILPYYSVIGGWVCKYAVVFFGGQLSEATSNTYFNDYISGASEPIVFFLIFAACTAVIILLGVNRGVENCSKILMPVLVLLTIIICIFTLTRDGAIDGIIYYIKPDFSRFSITTVLAALGQLFYSMSIAMGILITYGSYMQKDTDIVKSTHQVELFDTAIAFLAGLIIVPAVFVFSDGDPSMLSQGPGLMFVTLPKVFADMAGGAIIGTIFFILVLFAALTSAIALLEACVSIVCDKFKFGRTKVIIGISIYVMIVGGAVSLGFGPLAGVQLFGFGLLDFFDFISNSILMPLVALATCFFVGYVIKPKAIIEEVESTGPFNAKKFYTIMIRYIAPILIIGILIFSLLDGLDFIQV